MRIGRNRCVLLMVLGTAAVCSGQDLVLKLNKESGVYQPGEKIEFTFRVDGVVTNPVNVVVRENYVKETRTRLDYTGGETVVFSGSYDEPSAVMVEVRGGTNALIVGAVVAPERIQPSTERPAGIDDFWANEKKALRALPMETRIVPVTNAPKGFYCADVELNCTGPKPARGYLARPEGAAPKSLPIILFVHPAGVTGCGISSVETAVWCARTGKGALAFDLNAHGMPNGKPIEYYKALEEGELKQYMFQGMESREECYFRGMYLRLIRALDFLMTQPEWDGKRIMVQGGSQGGGQALAAASLHEKVTDVVARVPAMCDWGATTAGRKGGWPDPFKQEDDREKMLKTLPYFDVAHLIGNCKARLVVEIGFADITCPAMGVYAAMNQARCEKIIYGVPYLNHMYRMGFYKPMWERTVNRSISQFMSDFAQ